MVLVDVNILLHAINAESPHHVRASQWLGRLFDGPGAIALPWIVLLGFLRIATNPRATAKPLDTEDACSIVHEWLARPNVVCLEPGSSHWNILGKLLSETGTAGNLPADAHLAAIAIEHGCELCSTDTDFARFRGLKYSNPLSA